MRKVDFGRIGEKIAREYLIINKFSIIDKNYKIGGGEIDIIAKKNDCVHFIEVKTRTSEYWANIEDAIDDKKIEIIDRTAQQWFFRENVEEGFWQIDFIGIILKRNLEASKIVYLENIGFD